MSQVQIHVHVISPALMANGLPDPMMYRHAVTDEKLSDVWPQTVMDALVMAGVKNPATGKWHGCPYTTGSCPVPGLCEVEFAPLATPVYN